MILVCIALCFLVFLLINFVLFSPHFAFYCLPPATMPDRLVSLHIALPAPTPSPSPTLTSIDTQLQLDLILALLLLCLCLCLPLPSLLRRLFPVPGFLFYPPRALRVIGQSFQSTSMAALLILTFALPLPVDLHSI